MGGKLAKLERAGEGCQVSRYLREEMEERQACQWSRPLRAERGLKSWIEFAC